MGLDLYLDLYTSGAGAWSLQAFDLPDGETTSPTLPFSSADLRSVPKKTTSAKRLAFAEALLTPFASTFMADDVKTVYMYIYQPKDREQTLAFERRIEPRYQDYYAERGCWYAGLFDVDGLAGPYMGEILAFRASLGEAKNFVSGFEPAEDIAEIEDECRTLQERELPRFLLWLSR